MEVIDEGITCRVSFLKLKCSLSCGFQDETFDLVKKAQLRELAILNGTLREDSPAYMSGTVSPFNNPGMKRAKTRR